MKKIMGPGAMLLAGVLVILGNHWVTSQVLAQSGAQTMEEKQQQELRQKRQEQWEYLDQKEKKQHPGLKRQEDALKRQKDAERRLRELERQEK